jgi:hypothetical protein
VFVRHPSEQGSGSLNGASGGLLVAIRNGGYRPVAVLVEEQGPVQEVSVDSCERSQSPSAFHALPLFDLRAMIQNAGRLPFRNRRGTIVLELRLAGDRGDPEDSPLTAESGGNRPS